MLDPLHRYEAVDDSAVICNTGFAPRDPHCSSARPHPSSASRNTIHPPTITNNSSTKCGQQKGRKMSQHTASNSTNFSNNSQSFNNNVWNNYAVADDRSQLLAWLSPLEPKLRHRDIQEHRVDSVGEWLMQTEEFRSWRDCRGGGGGGNAVLFCYGAPGVGKTFIR